MEKFKSFCKDNSDILAAAGFAAVVVGGYVALFKYADGFNLDHIDTIITENQEITTTVLKNGREIVHTLTKV